MANLLSLPLELRIQILQYALSSSAPPASETETEKRAKKVIRVGRWNRKFELPDLNFQGISSIFLLNRQIRKEIAELSPPAEYHLDLIVWQRLVLCIPQWIYISRPTHNIDTLRCTIRPQGSFECGLDNSGFFSDDNGPGRRIYIFHRMLLAFFKHGPRLKSYKEKRLPHEGFTIKKLIINVQSFVPEGGVRLWSPELPECERHYGPGRMFRFNPDYLHKFLLHHMDLLLKCGYHSGSLGEPMYQHVGSIEFQKDGVVTGTFNLNDRLKFYKDGPRPADTVLSSRLRVHWTRQVWIPLVQRYRAERGLGSEGDVASGEARVAEAPDITYYKSWAHCFQNASENLEVFRA